MQEVNGREMRGMKGGEKVETIPGLISTAIQ